MNDLLIGVDIGGTKCAVVLGSTDPKVLDRTSFPTDTHSGPDQTIGRIVKAIEDYRGSVGSGRMRAIGISCGGPLDSKRGIILSPPNLPGWDSVPIVAILARRFGVPVFLQNDANACALAEWRWGAGRGTRNMIFLTFGTGLGAGLILNSRLYSGTSGMAGEVGHIRLESEGPLGHGKKGSFEGFCSGGGISQLAKIVMESWDGEDTELISGLKAGKRILAKEVCEAASRGDSAAIEILRISGQHLGKGLSILIDILNPERIVIGSVYARCREHLEPYTQSVLDSEALSISRGACTVVPSYLGEKIGDYGCLSVAMEAAGADLNYR